MFLFRSGAARKPMVARMGGACLLFIASLVIGGGQAARATEAYAQKEGRACQYCHVSGIPGSINEVTNRRETTDLNKRGLYYRMHNYSMEGYVEARVAPNVPPPLFRFIARDMLPDTTRRIAVADVTGDHTPRLITLNAKPDVGSGSVLTIKKWDGKTFVTEFSGETPGAADKLEVGRFTADGKTVILTERSAWLWNGKTYTRKDAAQAMDLLGSIRLRADGSERVLAASSPTDIRACRVDVNSAALLTDSIAAPSSGLAQMEMHNTPEFFDKMNYPTELTRGGIIGLMMATKLNKQFLYHVDLDQDIDVKNDPTGLTKPKLVLKSQGWKVSVVNAREPGLANQFFTPRLAGDIYDVAAESAYGDHVPGLLILTSEGPDKKGRSLYFFALNTEATAPANGVKAVSSTSRDK